MTAQSRARDAKARAQSEKGAARPGARGLPVIGTGVAGLDEILGGGLPVERYYLLGGDPGSGKTTLALQFLLEGRERGVYVTLAETSQELDAAAASHGWSLDGIE